MRSSLSVLCFLMILASSILLGQCGRKSTDASGGTTPQAGPYVPEDWNGEADWSGNALKVEELAP